MLRFLLCFVIVVALLLHNIPLLVRDQAVLWLLNNGAEEARLTALEVDWFSGRIELRGLEASAADKPVLGLERVAIDLDYGQLTEKRIRLSALELTGINIGIREQADQLWLGPLDLNQLSVGETEESASGEPSNWSFGLDQLSLERIQWQAEMSGLTHRLQLRTGHLAHLYLWDQEQPVRLDLDGEFNGAPLKLASHSKPLPEDKSSELSLKLDNFPLHSVTALFLPSMRGYLDLDLKIKAEANLTNAESHLSQSGSIRLRQFKFQQDDLNLSQESLAWEGKLNLRLKGTQLISLDHQGDTRLQTLALDLADTKLRFAGLKLKDQLQMQGLEQLQAKGLDLNGTGLDLSVAGQKIKAGTLALQGDLSTPDLAAWQARLPAVRVSGLAVDASSGESVQLQNLALSGNLQRAADGGLKLEQLVLNLKQLALKQAEQQLGVGSFDLNASLNSPDLVVWNVTAPELSLSDLQLSHQQTPLLTLANAAVKGVQVAFPEQIALSTVKLDKLRVEGEEAPLTQWQNIGISSLSLKQLQQLRIARLTLGPSQSRVRLSDKRGMPDLDWLLARLSPQSSAPAESKPASGSGADFRVRIDQLALQGSNLLEFQDQGVRPVFKTKLDLYHLGLKQLDTGSKGETGFEFKAKSNFSELSGEGAIELFSGNYGGHWKARVKGLDLQHMSPYSLAYTGYYLQSGQLSLDSSGTIKDRILKGKNDIRLNKLEVEAQNKARSDSFDQKVSMPLGTAIMVLQDNDNNIDLDIPLDGSLDDPSFGYQSVINKLAGKGLKNAALGYLGNALQPFGALISIGRMVMDAQSSGSFITLQPVEFMPAAAELSADSGAYMQKLAGLMNERKGIRMNICGLAVAADQPLLWEQLFKDNEKRKKPLEEAGLQAELEAQLLALAEARSDQVKQALLDHGIDVERLFSCYPKANLEDQEAPRVMLGF